MEAELHVRRGGEFSLDVSQLTEPRLDHHTAARGEALVQPGVT